MFCFDIILEKFRNFTRYIVVHLNMKHITIEKYIGSASLGGGFFKTLSTSAYIVFFRECGRFLKLFMSWIGLNFSPEMKRGISSRDLLNEMNSVTLAIHRWKATQKSLKEIMSLSFHSLRLLQIEPKFHDSVGGAFEIFFASFLSFYHVFLHWRK